MDLPDLLAWPRRHELPGLLFRRLIARHATRGLLGLSRAEQVVWVGFELCGEGPGEGEFFAFSSGEHAPLVPDVLRALGEPALAEQLGRALRHFPAGAERTEFHVVTAALGTEARSELEAAARVLEAASGRLQAALVRFIEQHPTEFTLANAGLAAFAPIEVGAQRALGDVLRLLPDLAVPALYVRIVTRAGIRSDKEDAFALATQAFAELSDEGGESYLFCSQAARAMQAREALEAAGAGGAAEIVGQAMRLLPAPYPVDTATRRAALAALSEDAQVRLRSLQWELDALRRPTIQALYGWARANERSFS